MNKIYKASVLLWGIFLFFGELYAQDYSNKLGLGMDISHLSLKNYSRTEFTNHS